MTYRSLYLKPKKEASLLRFHPWIFSGAVGHVDGEPNEGEIVRVLDCRGAFLAVGHFQYGSIAVRILSFEDIAIDEAYFTQRLQAAVAMRRSLNLQRPDNTAMRLVHGEGDGLPGLVIDLYGAVAVMQAHSTGMHLQREAIASALKQVMGDDLHAIYYKSEGTRPGGRHHADADVDGYLLGNEASDVALENGLRFQIDWLKGQKTGFFVDQRDNRARVEHYAKGRRVLNMFCYTGGFSVYALRGGATEVHSVDSSARAVDLTEQNVRLNFPEATNHKAFAEDAFHFLTNADNQYDLIILDPPAFAKHKDALHNALKGYTRLNAKAFEKIAPDGILFTFSCSQAVSKEQFRLAVFTAAAQSGRFVRILEQLHQPADHPVNIYHPEGEYLKGLVLQVE